MSNEFELNTDDELMTLVDEEGNETLYRKLMEFHHPGFDKTYVIVAEESNYNSEADLSRKKRSKVIDKMAAVFILQGYLDRFN